MVIRGRAITAIKKQQQRKRLKHYGVTASLVVLNVLIYVGALALAFHLPMFRINATVVAGVTGARASEVQSKIQNLLTESSFYIFPKFTTITTGKNLAASLTGAIPWIELATVKTDESNALHVQVVERKPAYIVCDANDVCYYADINTLVFAQAPDFSAPVYPELKTPRPATSSIMMTNVFAPDIAKKVEELLQAFLKQDVHVSAFEETAEGSFKIYTKEGWYVRMTNDESPRSVSDSLHATIQSAKFAGEYKQNPKNLEYIDVRLIDKVFYKFSGNESHATTTFTHN